MTNVIAPNEIDNWRMWCINRLQYPSEHNVEERVESFMLRLLAERKRWLPIVQAVAIGPCNYCGKYPHYHIVGAAKAEAAAWEEIKDA